MFYEGQQIGQYKLVNKLGKGGFGEVWLAEKRSQFVTKRVAVKLPLDDHVNFEAIRQEATLWEQASGHANVLPIIDADAYDGQVVIVSEYADGGSLHDKLKTEGKLPIKQAVEMTIGILKGLEFLHNKQIIHRDIKPQNILLQGETPRLADFGISRAIQTSSNSSSTVIGTDAYMSPESFMGKRSVQTDIWSVGVVFYQLLKGKLPFPQEHPSERMYAILQRDFEPLPANIPQSLKTIIAKALAKLPENRYKTATEMREDLSRVLRGKNLPPKNSPETETVLRPKSSPKSEPIKLVPPKQNVYKDQPALATIIESETLKKTKPLNSPIKTFAKLFIGAVFLVGFAVLLLKIKYFEDYFEITKPNSTYIPDAPRNTMPSATLPKNIALNPTQPISTLRTPTNQVVNTYAEKQPQKLNNTNSLANNGYYANLNRISAPANRITNNFNSDEKLMRKVQNALWKQGFTTIRITMRNNLIVLQGYVPKGKMVEVIQTAQETIGKPVINELLEQ